MRSKITSLNPLLIMLAVAMTLVVLGVSCGGAATSTTAAPAAQVPAATAVPEVAQVAEATAVPEVSQVAAQPKYGGSLTIAVFADNLTLDPAIVNSASDIAITSDVYDNLLIVQEDLSLKPELATSWEPNEDLSSYTFHLRKGVRFHHGKDFKAEDVLFTFNRLMDPVLDSPVRSVFATTVQDIVAVDDYTVRFDLNGPNGFFIPSFSLFQARILPADVDVSRLTLEEFGSGPFKILEHRPGERTILERFDDYWEEGSPYLDELIFLLIPEPATRLQALLSGDVDLVYELAAHSVAAVEAHSDTAVIDNTTLSWIGLPMRNDTPPFDNKLVRKAFQLATDRATINQAAYLGRGSVAYDHPIHPSDPLFTTKCKPPDYNPQAAKALLAEAGYPDGIDVILYTADAGPALIELAVAYKEVAAPAGIRVDVQRVSPDGYYDMVWNHEAFTTVRWSARPTPDQALTIQNLSGAAWNAPKYNNPEFDALVVRARGEPFEKQKETYAEIQCMLIDDVPRISVAFQPSFYGVRKSVRGVLPHPLSSNGVRFHYAWLDD